MEHQLSMIILILTAVCQSNANSMFGWLGWGKPSDDTTVLVADGVPLVSIPYEAMTEDEKFLQEAAKFTDIQVSSPLETCQHKVIMKIRTSCSDMTEEELAKLSVNLLNCQSAVEGRKMFPCTEEMSLKQCTTDMDADMWNAYHLMSNRARAVCYAARSTQFRALTELTVNKLMQTAHTQIKTLTSLKESQDRLEEQTVEALSSLNEGNKALLQQQQHLKDAQTTAHKLVTTNLRELSNERALIRSGHIQLAAMAEDIRNKLEEASQNLQQQATERGENHREILEDLMNIQEQAQLIWDKIETSTSRIFKQHEEAIDQYEQTLQRLSQINDTIQFIWNVTNTMRAEVDQKLDWLTNYIGDTGEQMQRMYRTGLHVVYLLVAMVVAAFLQAPFLTRVTIMGIVPLNLMSYLKHGAEASLDFTSMTALIFLITTMHFLMAGIQCMFGPSTKKRPEPVQFVQNGYANGSAKKYESSIDLKQRDLPSVPFYAKLKNTVVELYNFVSHQMNRCAQTCVSVIQSAVSWSTQGFSQREELSCSYMPSRKTREEVIYDYPREFPNMSSDVTDFDTTQERDNSVDDYHHLIDANDLRLRLGRAQASVSSSTDQPTLSRSGTPSYAAPRVMCSALTRTGRHCRKFAMTGLNVCHRHTTGSSIMGD